MRLCLLQDHSDSDIDISLLPEDLEDILGPLEGDDEERVHMNVAGTPAGKRVVSVKASTGLHVLEPASDSEIAVRCIIYHVNKTLNGQVSWLLFPV